MALSAAAPVEYSLLVHARVGLAGAHVEVDAVDERNLDVDAGAGYAAELAEALDHRGLLLLDDGQNEHGLDHEADSLEEDHSGFLCVVGLLSRLDPHYTDGAC